MWQERFEGLYKIFVEGNGVGVACCADVGGAVALFVRCHEGELAHDEGLAAGVRDAAVHHAVFIVENAQAADFFAKPVGIVARVGLFNAEEDEKDRPDE